MMFPQMLYSNLPEVQVHIQLCYLQMAVHPLLTVDILLLIDSYQSED